jgi:NDP-sugar pyrophosphorylase family protein
MPFLAGNASGFIIEDYLLDIGTPEKLRQAEIDLENGKIKIEH